ncbi:MAG: SpoIVB peptidase [Clostridiales bacterium]|nr:SpoIVB peptidase [Clostridiales bacterium]
MLINYTGNSFSVTAASDGSREVVVCGDIIGVKIDMKGVMVLGLSSFPTEEGRAEPAADILKPGDMLLYAGNRELSTKEALMEAVEESGGEPLSLAVSRNGKSINLSVTPVLSAEGGYKLGIWIRDSTQGLGTLTFYDKETGRFGALGHGITDVDTGKLMTVSGGEICSAQIGTVVKEKKGSPGEILGEIDFDSGLGEISDNNKLGIYGSISETYKGGKVYKVGKRREVHTGEAYILSGIDGEVKKYSVKIENIIPFTSESSKCMTVRITDERLLNLSGGIIQGMSGSPIIQNDKIIGAVTHVFLNNPEKGYGIFIENML